jgi:hypothetical protein
MRPPTSHRGLRRCLACGTGSERKRACRSRAGGAAGGAPVGAGGGIFATKPDPTDPPIAHDFSAWTGFAVFAMYAAITLLAAMLAFRNRDA